MHVLSTPSHHSSVQICGPSTPQVMNQLPTEALTSSYLFTNNYTIDIGRHLCSAGNNGSSSRTWFAEVRTSYLFTNNYTTGIGHHLCSAENKGSRSRTSCLQRHTLACSPWTAGHCRHVWPSVRRGWCRQCCSLCRATWRRPAISPWRGCRYALDDAVCVACVN